MHDPKFEKVVQQKMEELAFNPPERVWTKVEEAIRKDKRRRVPLFWLFFLPGSLLLGAGVTYLLIGKKTQPVQHAIAIPANGNEAGSSEGTTVSAERVAPSGKTTVASGTIVSSGTTIASGTASSETTSSSKRTPAFTGTPASSAKTPASVSPGKRTSAVDGLAAKDKDDAEILDHSGDRGSLTEKGMGNDDGKAAERQGRALLPDLAVVPAGHQDIATTIGPLNQQKNGNIATGLMADKQAKAKSPVQLAPRRPWEAAFSGGVGISSMNQALFSPSTINAYYVSQNAGTSITGATQKATSDKVRPGLSFWAGVAALKPFSDRVNISIGLNLHYYSTRIHTGQQVTNDPTPLNISGSLLRAPRAVTTAAAFQPYFPTGNDVEYTNRYYFMELPVAIQLQLNRSRMMPVFWESGVAFSYLMSSDALYYNTVAKVYYKDGGVANRGHVNLHTALMIGLPFCGSRLQFGPQLEYGVTRLLNENAAGDGHLFYGGLKFVVVPGKRKK